MMRFAAALAFMTVALPSPVSACSYSQIPEDVGDSSAQFLAREMVRAATYVDLVLVEDDGTRPMSEAATGVLTLRSIAHLKGNGPDRFSLFGTGLTLQPEAERVIAAPLQHFTGDDGRVRPFAYNEERQGQLLPGTVNPTITPPPPPPPTSSCSPGSVAGQTGRFYVVMRGRDGRLLGNFSLYEEARTPAFGFVPVTLERTDHWLRAALGAVPGSAATDEPNVLYLRDGADAARVEASLRRAGVTPIAAYIRNGERIDEVRPSDMEVAYRVTDLSVRHHQLDDIAVVVQRHRLSSADNRFEFTGLNCPGQHPDIAGQVSQLPLIDHDGRLTAVPNTYLFAGYVVTGRFRN